ncbi:MAG: hypothetical protein ACMUIU_18535 [bacterium]
MKTGINKKSLLKKLVLLQISVVFIFIINITCTEAYRRKIDLGQQFEESNIMHWTTVIKDKMYDVYVDRNTETIIIYGDVKNLDEKEEVEEYFKSKSPGNYKLISELNIENEIDK